MRKLALLFAAAFQTGSQPVPVDVSYCDLVAKSAEFNGKTVRVAGVYELGFEKSVLTAPACAQSLTWLSLNKGWDKKTDAALRDRIKDLKWAVPLDVVAVGGFQSGGKFGHMGLYSTYMLVDHFESR